MGLSHYVKEGFVCLLLCPPWVPGPGIIDQEAYALVVRRIQPEHPLEEKRRLGKPFQPPKREPVSLQAPQKRAVVHVTPRERTVKSGGERELADAQADCIMPDGFLWIAIKSKIAEVRMGIETTQIGFAKFHEHFFRFLIVPRVFEINRIGQGPGRFPVCGSEQPSL